MREVTELLPRRWLNKEQLLARYALAEQNCEQAILEMHDVLQILQERSGVPIDSPDYDDVS